MPYIPTASRLMAGLRSSIGASNLEKFEDFPDWRSMEVHGSFRGEANAFIGSQNQITIGTT